MKCKCALAGYCETHKLQTTEDMHKRCKASDAVFENFAAHGKALSRRPTATERSTLPGRKTRPRQRPRFDDDFKINDTPCALRGEELREQKCDVCSYKSVVKTIYACPKHGECFEGIGGFRVRGDLRITACRFCQDHEDGQPESPADDPC